jgi:putative PIN family toxin of toxin-antitoxin system
MPVKAVIDTSVMVSLAFAQDGLAKELRDMIADGRFTLVASKKIMAELYRVLHYPRILKQFEPVIEDIEEFIGMAIEKSSITEGSYTIHKIEDDPTDDMFPACAMEAEADYIVLRDPHLRNVKQFRGIGIIDVKTFVERVKSGK